MKLDAWTQKAELNRAAIVGASQDLAFERGLEEITLQAVADRIRLSKSGVFSRVGSREALRRMVTQVIDAGHLRGDTDAEQVVSELSGLIIGLLHDARFLRDARAADRCRAAWSRLFARCRV